VEIRNLSARSVLANFQTVGASRAIFPLEQELMLFGMKVGRTSSKEERNVANDHRDLNSSVSVFFVLIVMTPPFY